MRVLVVQNMQFTSNAVQEKGRREAGQIMKGGGQTTKNNRHVCQKYREITCNCYDLLS